MGYDYLETAVIASSTYFEIRASHGQGTVTLIQTTASNYERPSSERVGVGKEASGDNI